MLEGPSAGSWAYEDTLGSPSAPVTLASVAIHAVVRVLYHMFPHEVLPVRGPELQDQPMPSKLGEKETAFPLESMASDSVTAMKS